MEKMVRGGRSPNAQREMRKKKEIRCFKSKRGAGACLVDGIKGGFGYLKPKLAIVYSF